MSAVRHASFARVWIAAVALAAVAAGPATRPATRPAGVPDLNRAVLKYAVAHLGQTVGDGDCTTLARAALRSAGAERNHGYRWGRKLAADEPLLPGDVMQFTRCVLAGHDARHWWKVTLGLPHHTAIVRAVLGKTRFEILQQNPGPVNALAIDFRQLQSGTWEAYRPVPADEE